MHNSHPMKNSRFKWDEIGKQALKYLMNLFNQDISMYQLNEKYKFVKNYVRRRKKYGKHPY